MRRQMHRVLTSKNDDEKARKKFREISKKIIVTRNKGPCFLLKSTGLVGCPIVTVWLPYVPWKSSWMPRLGGASLPTSGVIQIKEDT